MKVILDLLCVIILCISLTSMSCIGLCTTTDDVTGGWKILEFTVDGNDASKSLITKSMDFRDKTSSFATFSVPNLDLQPAPEQLESEAVIKLECKNDSLFLVDNRFHVFTGAYSVVHTNAYVDTLHLKSSNIELTLVEILMTGENWDQIVVPSH